MKFRTLFSGSKGNCALLEIDSKKILVDCGGSMSRIVRALKENSVSVSDIDAIFITHEHHDHVSSLRMLCANSKIKIFSHEKSACMLEGKILAGQNLITFNSNELDFYGTQIETYDCYHDSAHCVGYKFTSENKSIATITDLGCVTDKLLTFVKNCELILLESNHDEMMLKSCDYPNVVKERILGNFGHLSNVQAGKIIVQLPAHNVRNVWLGHISLNSNTPEVAFDSAFKCCKEARITEGKDIKINVVGQYAQSGVFKC